MDIDQIDCNRWLPDRTIVYKEADCLCLPMQLFYPPDHRPGKAYPAILCIHGGAWSGRRDNSAWDGGILAAHARYFASRGAVGVVISYRNVNKPHPDHSAFINGPSLVDLYSDCRSAMRYLRLHSMELGIRADRIAAYGDSAGGHLAACLGTIHRYDTPGEDNGISAMADVVIAYNAILDLTDPAWLHYVPENPQGLWPKGMTRTELAKSISPLHNITQYTVPFLLLHGLKDKVVHLDHSRGFNGKMQEFGNLCKLCELPDAGHAFALIGYKSSYRQVMEALRETDQFLASLGYLQGEPTIGFPPVVSIPEIVVDFHAAADCAAADNVDLANHIRTIADGPEGTVFLFEGERKGLELPDIERMGGSTSVVLRMNPHLMGGELVSRRAGFGTDIHGFSLLLDSEHGLMLRVGAEQVYLPQGTDRIRLGQWNDVACTIHAGTASIYVNGDLLDRKVMGETHLAGNRLRIGAEFTGCIRSLQVFRGLAFSDITEGR